MNLKDEANNLGVKILERGSICMYHSFEILEDDMNWFDRNNYRVVDMDVLNWSSGIVFKNIMSSLGLQGMGENLDAFDDYLDDMLNRKYKGLILVFRHFDNLASTDKDLSEGLLDVIAETSRRWLIQGQHLIGMIQSDDPDFYLDKIGGRSPLWNWQEWFDDKRKEN